MILIDTCNAEGKLIPEPYKRLIKVIFSKDINSVNEITFSSVSIYPSSKTDCHSHDRPELIYVISGEGILFFKGKEYILKEGFAIWVIAGEEHQLKNTGLDFLKIVTVFVPGYKSDEIIKKVSDAAERDKG